MFSITCWKLDVLMSDSTDVLAQLKVSELIVHYCTCTVVVCQSARRGHLSPFFRSSRTLSTMLTCFTTYKLKIVRKQIKIRIRKYMVFSRVYQFSIPDSSIFALVFDRSEPWMYLYNYAPSLSTNNEQHNLIIHRKKQNNGNDIQSRRSKRRLLRQR